MMFLREQQDIGEQNKGVRYRFDLWFSKVLAGFQLSGVGVTKTGLKALVRRRCLSRCLIHGFMDSVHFSRAHFAEVFSLCLLCI